ncbi:MAG: type II secretion system F family protein [Candidatus Nanopelagicales bacterium]
MGALLGLVAGVGALLVFHGLTTAPSPRQARRSRLELLIERSGVRGIGVPGLVGACMGVGLVTLLLVLVVTAVPAVALVAGALGSYLPITLLKRRATQREKALRDAWPDAVDALVSAVRAGMSLPEAVGDLAVRGPEPLRRSFALFASEHRATASFAGALDALKEDLADPVADRVVASLRTAREVGGSDLGTVLRTLSEFLREDARTRGEIEARQSWSVNAARLAVAAPWVTLLLLSARQEAVQAYNSTEGLLVLAVAAGLSVVAYRLMLRIGRIPVEQRVLA